jgi:sugar phosphate permease
MSTLPFLRDNARWLTGGFLLNLFSSYGQTFFIALSSGDIRAEFSLSHGDFGWLYMAATLLGAALITLVGKGIDTITAERYAVFVIGGLAASMALLVWSPNVAVLFIALAGVRMFGQGLMGHTAFTAIGRWFALKRGRAVSVVALGHQVVESIAPICFVALMGLVGWRGG